MQTGSHLRDQLLLLFAQEQSVLLVPIANLESKSKLTRTLPDFLFPLQRF